MPELSRKRRRRAMGGLARLRQECHRYRKEVEFIRSLPYLQRRWPSLARLEIGNESSEEDSMIWDSMEAPKSDPLSTVDTIEAPNLDPWSTDSKEECGCSAQTLGSSKVGCWRSQEVLETVHTSADTVDIIEGCEAVETKAIHANRINEESGREPHQGSPLQTFNCNIAVPLTGFISTSDQFYDERLHHDCWENFTKGQNQDDFHTNSGARKAATALFTANPHHRSLELPTQCSPYNNWEFRSERFKLGFPGSNVPYHTIHKERSGEVLCSSFDSYMSSPSEHTGCIPMDARNQTSRLFETDSRDDEAGLLEKASLNTQIHGQMDLLPDNAPYCSSEIGSVHANVQTRCALKSPDFYTAPAHAAEIVDGCNLCSKQLGHKNHIPSDTNLANKQRMAFSSGKDSLKGFMPVPLSENGKNQNCLFKELKQKTISFATDEDGQPLSPSGAREISLHPSGDFVPQGFQAISTTEDQPENGPEDKQFRSLSGLIALSGVRTFARLELGSSTDISEATQMVNKVKQDLEGLDDYSNQDNGLMKPLGFRTRERKMGYCFSPIMEKRKGAPSSSGSDSWTDSQTDEGNISRLGLKVSGRTGVLRTDNDMSRMESHFFTQRNDFPMPGSDYHQNRCTTGLDSHVLNSSYVHSATPKGPDLYLQHDIPALSPGQNIDVLNTALGASPGIRQEEVNDDHSHVYQTSMSRKSSEGHRDGSLCASTGEVLEFSQRRDCVHDHQIFPGNNIVSSESSQVVKQPQNFVRSEFLQVEKQPQNLDSKTGEFNSSGFHPNQGFVEVTSNEQPGFLVEINAPAGSFVEVELGGSRNLCESQQEKSCQDTDTLRRNSNSSLLYHKSLSCDSCISQCQSFDHGRLDHPLVFNHRGCDPQQQRNLWTSIDKEQYAPRSVSPLKTSQVEGSRSIGQTTPRRFNLSPERNLQTKLRPMKVRKCVRFNLDDDDLTHTQKSTPLASEDYCPNEMTLDWTSTRQGHQTPRLHQRQLKVTRNQKPSILKSSKFYDVQPAQTAKKLEDFAAAAAGLACELKGFTKHGFPELHMESRDQRQLSGKKTVSTRPLHDADKYLKHDNEVQARGEMKNRGWQKMLSTKKSLCAKHVHSRLQFSGSDLKGDDKIITTIPNFGKHDMPPREVKWKSKEGRHLENAKKEVNNWEGGTLNYDVFCQVFQYPHILSCIYCCVS